MKYTKIEARNKFYLVTGLRLNGGLQGIVYCLQDLTGRF